MFLSYELFCRKVECYCWEASN